MPDLSTLISKFHLIVVKASSASVARSYVEQQLAAARHGDNPLWQCGPGLLPERVSGLNESPTAPKGKAAQSMAAWVRAFQGWKRNAFLMVHGADDLGDDPELPNLVRLQHDDPNVQPWLLLVSQSGHPVKLLQKVDTEASWFTVDANPATAGARVTPRRTAPLDLSDLKKLSSFDTPEWTLHLDTLSLTELAEICDNQLYMPALDRVRELRLGLSQVFVQKEEVIDLMMECTVAGLPLLLLGSWGTGKSMLVRQFAAGLGIAPANRRIDTEEDVLTQLAEAAHTSGGNSPAARRTAQELLRRGSDSRHFEYLVTRFTTPEELLGAVDVEMLLSHSIHFRLTRSLMPRAEIVFLDEVFKSNSAILNALLSLIQERLFHNAGVPWTVNLVMLFGASNEPPQDEDLGAFYDRFPARVLCLPVGNQHLRELLDHAHTQQYAALIPPTATEAEIARIDRGHRLTERRIKTCACVNDFRLLRRVCLYRFGGIDLADASSPDSVAFLERFVGAFRYLRQEHDVSDRSFAHYYRLARARALIDGRETLKPEDCQVLSYCGKTPEALRVLPGIVEGLT